MIKNILGRDVPDGMKPFLGSDDFRKYPRHPLPEIKAANHSAKLLASVSEAFDRLHIHDGMTLSFHHHLRNGDFVLNMAAEEILKRNLKNMVIAPSSIFPTNAILSKMIENGNITKIYTDYLSGEVAKTIGEGKMKDLLIMDTHGGRSRAIESGDIAIDVAFIAVPCADKEGNGNGFSGPSACGSLGYAIPDMLYAKHKVAVTDYLDDVVSRPEIKAEYIDYVVKTEKIGNQAGIVSGTTKITKDPIGLVIARNTAFLLDELGLLENGFSMQTGAGGTSLAVASYVRKIMLKKGIRAKFGCGGITSYFVKMLEEGLMEDLYDVQCFDLDAVKSIAMNPHHHPISAFEYANPYVDSVADKLDFVILGATEIDLDRLMASDARDLAPLLDGPR
jgi:citrate lyase subunit alpha/citrate CoA-transferase